jgi:hypothetical protein
MRPIFNNTVIQIDISHGACHLACAHCTRAIGHHRKPSFMPLDMIRQAIESLDGFDGQIGCMGGEPALHPKFPEVLAIWREMVPRHRRSLWTSGWKWKEYREIIFDTFDENLIHYNDHTQETGRHQPLLVAIEEVVDDPELRAILIKNCPFQLHWSAAITPLGCYFCEIAAAQGALFGVPGYPIEPGWWRKTPEQFQDQVDAFCSKCSGALPMPSYSDGRGGRDGPTIDLVSPGNLERLLAMGSPKAKRGHVEVWDRKFPREEIIAGLEDWQPRSFRDFEAHAPEDYEGILCP